MENKINLAAILKDCPRGMELDCSIHTRPVIFNCVKMESDYPIRISSKDGFSHSLTYWGSLYNCEDAKCVIFPKGETTWEGFQGPFKDGDVVATNSGAWLGITTGGEKEELMPTYCIIKSNGTFEAYLGTKKGWYFSRLATEEEKQKLFDAIKANGYCWNAETKTLEKLIELKFKVGDKVRGKYTNSIYTISGITPTGYELTNGQSFTFNAEDCHELVADKFDITTLKPFDRVLVKSNITNRWIPSLFGCLRSDDDYPYVVIGGVYWKCCIPYEGNEHLLDTTDDCDEYYKTWE